MSARRGVLWGVLVAALLAVAVATLWQRLSRPMSQTSPPVLGAVPDFALTNRDGRTVRRADLAGAPWVADFIFTRCGASCPLMTRRMARFGRDLPKDLAVHFVSFSVDPDYDTPAVLERYARSFAAPDRWLFLTGGRAAILRLCREGFKLAVDAAPPPLPGARDESILHSTRFVLVDGQGRIRGYYEGFDEESMRQLARDLSAL